MRVPVVGLIALILAPGHSAQTTTAVSVTGFLTDTHCGRRGATALHIDCAKRNVAAGRAQYAVYDEATKKLYIVACSTPVASDEWRVASNPDHRCIEQYLGQRVRVTGSVTATPITRAGQTLAPDAVAAPRDAAGHADQSAAARTVTGDPAARSGPGPVRVQNHPKALDTTTPVAGVLSIASVEVLPSSPRTP